MRVVELVTDTPVAAVAPIDTLVDPLTKLVPMAVTVEPTLTDVGLRDASVGAGRPVHPLVWIEIPPDPKFTDAAGHDDPFTDIGMAWANAACVTTQAMAPSPARRREIVRSKFMLFLGW